MLRVLLVSIMLLAGTTVWAQDRGGSLFPPVPPAQQPAATPVVVTNQQPPADSTVSTSLFGGLGAIIMGLLGKIAFFPGKGSSSAPAAPDLSKLEPIIKDVLTKVIQSGALAPAITGLLGPFGPLEPVVRNIVLTILSQHGVIPGGVLQGTQAQTAGTMNGSLFPSANPPVFQQIDHGQLAAEIASHLRPPAAPSPPAG